MNECAPGRSSGSTPFLAFPCEQWLVEGMAPLARTGHYSYGDSAGMNRTSLLMATHDVRQPNARQNYVFSADWYEKLFPHFC